MPTRDKTGWTPRSGRPTIGYFLCAGLTLFAALGMSNCADANPFHHKSKWKAPFDIVGSVTGKPVAGKCPKAPTPMVTLETNSRYDQSDPTKSKVDPERSEAYEEVIAPLRDYQAAVSASANKYTESGGKRIGEGLCALAWLDAWAEADALTDMRTEGAVFNRSETLSALTLAYMQVSNLREKGRDRRPRIEAWLGKLGEATRKYYDDYPPNRNVLQNNHRYWAGLAATATGIVSESPDLVEWGYNSYRIGVCQVTPDGALPRELGRAGRALTYHFFATAPLVMTAKLAQANGTDLFQECDGALDRLVQFTLRAYVDPSLITALNGVEQEQSKSPSRSLAWTAAYFSDRAIDEEWRKRLDALAPLRVTLLGGNLSMLYEKRSGAEEASGVTQP